MDWTSFQEACPEIANIALERFQKDQLVMLGTLRFDGSPRISPCEVDFAEGHLMLGMMWKSPKAIDLLRDPRIVVHSVTINKDGTDGDVKIYGLAQDVHDPDMRSAFQKAIRKRIDWAPDEPEFHLFTVDMTSAGYTVFSEGTERVLTWEPSSGLKEWTKPG